MKIWTALAGRWSNLVFAGHLDRVTPHIRALRVLEEVLELCQAEGVTPEEAAIIARQVFGRPVGDPEQELGGVMTTLMAYAYTAGRDVEAAWWAEFQRIMDPAIMDKVRRRNLEGDKIGLNPLADAPSGVTSTGCPPSPGNTPEQNLHDKLKDSQG